MQKISQNFNTKLFNIKLSKTLAYIKSIINNHHHKTWQNLILWTPLFMSVGIVNYSSNYNNHPFHHPEFIITISIGLMCLISIMIFRLYILKYVIFVIFIVLLGFFATHLSFISNKTYMIEDNSICTITGDIESIRQFKNTEKGYYSNKILLKNVKIHSAQDKKLKDNSSGVHKIIIVSDQTLLIGEKIHVNLTIKPIKNSIFNVNAKITNYLRGISGTANFQDSNNSKNVSFIKIIGNNTDFIDKIRLYIHKKFLKLLGYINGGLASAITTGILDNTFHIREAFSKSGLAHILAISGLHMSIIATLVFLFFCKIFTIFFPLYSYRIAAILSIITTFLYTLLSSASISTTRSFLMSTFFLISIVFYRKTISLSSVMLTAAVMILFNPHFIFHPSFLLSFAAVITLIAYFSSTKPKKKFYDKVILLFKSSMISSLATAPYTLFFFHSISIYGVLSNIIAIPLVTFFILPLSILTIALMPIQEVPFTTEFLAYGINFLVQIARSFAELPQMDFSFFTITNKNIFFITLGGLFICLNNKKPLKYLGIIPILMNLPYSSDVARIMVTHSKASTSICFYNKYYKKKIRFNKNTNHKLNEKYILYEDSNSKFIIENQFLNIYLKDKSTMIFIQKHSIAINDTNATIYLNRDKITKEKM